MLLAEALLGYCKAALARVAYSGPRVGLTEESGDRSDATIEFAQWRLSKIFGDCTEAAHGILGAKEVDGFIIASSVSAWPSAGAGLAGRLGAAAEGLGVGVCRTPVARIHSWVPKAVTTVVSTPKRVLSRAVVLN
jgi:hypothetical protein